MENIFQVQLTADDFIAWLQALRSGEYRQCKGRLCMIMPDGIFYCAVGVLGVVMNVDDDSMHDQCHLDLINPEWLGPWDPEQDGPRFEAEDPSTHVTLQRMLAAMSDAGRTFDELADWLEQHLWRAEWGSALIKLGYWERQAEVAENAWRDSDGMFKGCYTLQGEPLSPGKIREVLAYLDAPSHEAWLEIRSLRIAGPMSLWQAWCAFDPAAPTWRQAGYPRSATLQEAIRAGVRLRRAKIQKALTEKQQGPHARS